jgi:hypothetical protein
MRLEQAELRQLVDPLAGDVGARGELIWADRGVRGYEAPSSTRLPGPTGGYNPFLRLDV